MPGWAMKEPIILAVWPHTGLDMPFICRFTSLNSKVILDTTLRNFTPHAANARVNAARMRVQKVQLDSNHSGPLTHP